MLNQAFLSKIFISGPITIGRGELAQTIYDWLLVKTVAFDFKINTLRRGRRFIAVLSELGGYQCCSIPNALFSVFTGNQTLLLYIKPVMILNLTLICRGMVIFEGTWEKGPSKCKFSGKLACSKANLSNSRGKKPARSDWIMWSCDRAQQPMRVWTGKYDLSTTTTTQSVVRIWTGKYY